MPVWGPHLGPPWMGRIAGFVATLPASGPAVRPAVERYLASTPGTPPEGRRTYVLYCSGCHGLKSPMDYTEEQWKENVSEMKEKAKIKDADSQLILKYLITAARESDRLDTAASGE